MEYDLLIDDLTVESSAKRLNQNRDVNSNNIINAILPFDTENAVAWDANFIRGVAAEKRSVNTGKLKEVVMLQCGDIARHEVMKELPEYTRGVRWDDEHLSLRGIKWKTAYLPVWLYSYQREGDMRIYYVAINARTGETVGSMPAPKLGERVSSVKRARHAHERETRVELQNFEVRDAKKSETTAWLNAMVGRNDDRAIGSLATGREDMLLSEKRYYENGSEYAEESKKAKSPTSFSDKVDEWLDLERDYNKNGALTTVSKLKLFSAILMMIVIALVLAMVIKSLF